MYKKNDKQRLYWLIDEYLSSKITEREFCDEFYYSFDLEIDKSKLSELERLAFSELNNVSSRFSEYDEDHQLDPKAFSTIRELKEKVIETKRVLLNREIN